jgi:hypothetical protein
MEQSLNKPIIHSLILQVLIKLAFSVEDGKEDVGVWHIGGIVICSLPEVIVGGDGLVAWIA